MTGLSLYKYSPGGLATGLNVIITYIRSGFEYNKLLKESSDLESLTTREAAGTWGTYITQVTNATEAFTDGDIEAQQSAMDRLYNWIRILNWTKGMRREWG
jgi:hypothetical protein